MKTSISLGRTHRQSIRSRACVRKTIQTERKKYECGQPVEQKDFKKQTTTFYVFCSKASECDEEGDAVQMTVIL
jgi:hypothetical protein